MTALASILDKLTAPAELAVPQPDGSVRCAASGHRCRVRTGRRGICQVRFHDGMELRQITPGLPRFAASSLFA